MAQKFLIFFVLLVLLFCLNEAADMPMHLIARRDNFDEIVSELRSKGSRMRFGKRSFGFDHHPLNDY
uniref:Uncharacterized protein n=1 Tax=Panagrolaimus sp. ES5 TaxID=591445 RepID=A0AC34GN48_9BILA